MRDYRFYGEGMEPKRLRWVVVPARRGLRRLMRPMLYRQVEILEDLGRELDEVKSRLDRLDAEVKTLAGLGWDHVAVTRRLAALEDRIESGAEGGR